MLSSGAPKKYKMKWSFGRSQKTTFFMSEIQSEIATTYYMPSSIKLFIHILFDLLGHLLLVRSVLKGMVDDMFGLVLDFRLHFGIERLYAPLLHPFLHSN